MVKKINRYTIGDAVVTGEWIKYTDTKTGNLVFERSTKTWKGRIYRLFLFFNLVIIRKWK